MNNKELTDIEKIVNYFDMKLQKEQVTITMLYPSNKNIDKDLIINELSFLKIKFDYDFKVSISKYDNDFNVIILTQRNKVEKSNI